MSQNNAILSQPNMALSTPSCQPDQSKFDGYPRLFVFGIWAALTGTISALIITLGTSVPVLDDWHFISPDVVRLGLPPTDAGQGRSLAPFLDHKTPLVPWLWKQADDHRFPLTKLAMWTLWRLRPCDLRPAMLSGFLGLAAGVLAVVVLVRRLRGYTEYADAFFPVLLLNFGHAGVFLWWTTMAVPWSTALISILGISLIGGKPAQGGGNLVLFGLGVLLLPLLGSLGVACALPFVGALFLFAGYFTLQRRLGSAIAAAVFAVGTVMLIAAYFWGFEKAGVQSPYVSVLAWMKTTLQFLTMGFGPMVKRFWPVSGVAFLAVGGAATVLLLYRVFRSRAERRLAAGLALLALASPLAGAAAVGLGRQLQGGLLERYSLYAAPMVCILYVVLVRFFPERLARFLQMTFFSAACAGLFLGFSSGLALAKDRRDRAAELRSAVQAGLPVTAVVARHGAYWGLNERSFREGIEILRDVGHPTFVSLRQDPPMQELALETSGAPMQMSCKEGLWEGRGRESKLVFSLGGARRVYAVRFSYILRSKRNSTTFRLEWHRADRNQVFEALANQEVTVNFNSAKPRRKETQTVWVNDTIDSFALSPCAEPCQFELLELVLLVPSTVSEK